MGKLFSPSSWSDLLGSCNLSQGVSHSRIAELEKSILLVEADHPGWVQLLQTKQRELLDEARRRFPEITLTGISFRLSRP
jgi:predicted nucleic acid-binding Zn ribbon protein